VTLRFTPTPIPGVVVVEPQVHRDARGFFLETYHAAKYREGGIEPAFVQDNSSRSARGTLRGLHAQSPNAQGKLLRVVSGEIYDVAVDARRGSPTYGLHFGLVLSGENFKQLYVPPGLLHGFVVTSDEAEVAYKCTTLYDASAEFSVAWNDPDLAIRWPIDEPILSPRDAAAPPLADVQDRLVAWEG
jgi:dTDP-4-dehydrorhamnose 3,5-epimerase